MFDDRSRAIQEHPVRRLFLSLIKYNPWFRALALTQYGGVIFMVKRA